MLYYYQFKPYLIGAAYIYGFIGLAIWSINIFFKSDSLSGSILGLIGIIVCINWAGHLYGLITQATAAYESDTDSQPTSSDETELDDQPASQSDLILAKQALRKRLKSRSAKLLPDGNMQTTDQVEVIKNQDGSYLCRFHYRHPESGVTFSYEYMVDSSRKHPVSVKTSEILSAVAISGGSVIYECDEPQPASHDQLFELYRRLDG